MKSQNTNESEMILRALKDDLLVVDKDGTILKESEVTKSLYGLDGKKIIGLSVYDLEKQGVFTPLVTPLVLKKKQRVNVIQTTKDGKKLLITGVPVFDDNGDVWRIASYSHDITEMANMKNYIMEMQGEMERVKTELEVLRNQQMKDDIFLGCSRQMKKCISNAMQVADVDVNVLLLGESGVGKTYLAKMIHKNSPRKDKPFIEVNCGAIPESLFEAELFGYEAGSFTNAGKSGKPGLVELAEGGTLFLDEIGELSLRLQVKLLMLIQEKQFYRVGGTRQKKVDFRLISATNQPLESLIEEKRFREDLYFRLNVVPIRIPPLRERTSDIVTLIDHFLQEFSIKYKRERVLDDAVRQQFYIQQWLGNVRELINLIERLVVTSTSRIITMSDLPDTYRYNQTPIIDSTKQNLNEILDEVEKQVLTRVRNQCKTTVLMAKVLGISQPSVVRKIKKYGIK